MKNLILLKFIFLSFVVCAQIKIPKNYKILDESPANGRPIQQISFLFDNDLTKDSFMLVVNEKEFSKYKLLIYLTSIKKQFDIDLISTNDSRIYPLQMKVGKNTLEFSYFEDGTATFGRFIKLRYNAQVQNIQIIGYDSEYKSSPTERIYKSYNLLTGKYIVKKIKYNFDDSKKVNEFFGINTFLQNRVFVTNLTEKMLNNLDDVGSKYE